MCISTKFPIYIAFAWNLDIHLGLLCCQHNALKGHYFQTFPDLTVTRSRYTRHMCTNSTLALYFCSCWFWLWRVQCIEDISLERPPNRGCSLQTASCRRNDYRLPMGFHELGTGTLSRLGTPTCKRALNNKCYAFHNKVMFTMGVCSRCRLTMVVSVWFRAETALFAMPTGLSS